MSGTIVLPALTHEMWETGGRHERDRAIAELTRRQVAFAKEHVPFYRRLYANLNVRDLTDLEACIVHVPSVRKSEIRGLRSPYELLPDTTLEHPHRIALHRGTGGTTGSPTSVFWTQGELNAHIAVAARPLASILPAVSGRFVFDNYNQGHISAPFFERLIRHAIPCGIVTRNFGSTDEQALSEIVRHKCAGIIAPPVSTHKGGSLEDLLEIDAQQGTNYINGDNIKFVVLSSVATPPELILELGRLGITNVMNAYGSTDTGGVAWSELDDPLHPQIRWGATSAFVVDEHQEPVRPGEEGYVIASRLSSLGANGELMPADGTGMINFHLGDRARLLRSPGSPKERVTGIARVVEVEDKIASGCQQW